VGVAGSAEKTPSVDDVALSGDAISFLYVGDEPAYLNDIPGKFVADHEWRLASPLRPGIPVVDVNIGATHSRSPDPNENFVLTDPPLRDILQFETGCRGLLDERFH